MNREQERADYLRRVARSRAETLAPSPLPRPRPARRDSRTERPLRQYLASYAPSRSVMRVTVIGEATELACREAVSEEVEELTGWVPEFITPTPVRNGANAEIVLGRGNAR